MTPMSKADLALAYLEVRKRREAAYVPGTYHYTRTYGEIADEVIADEELRPLVVSLLQAGYVDFYEWSMDMLKKHRPELVKDYE